MLIPNLSPIIRSTSIILPALIYVWKYVKHWEVHIETDTG